MAERRHLERHAIRVPVELDQGHGVTRDLSSDGAFFYTPQPPPVGSTIHFTISLADLASLGLTACCEGVVVRTEPDEQGAGVAVHITSIIFDSFANWSSNRSIENTWH